MYMQWLLKGNWTRFYCSHKLVMVKFHMGENEKVRAHIIMNLLSWAVMENLNKWGFNSSVFLRLLEEYICWMILNYIFVEASAHENVMVRFYNHKCWWSLLNNSVCNCQMLEFYWAAIKMHLYMQQEEKDSGLRRDGLHHFGIRASLTLWKDCFGKLSFKFSRCIIARKCGSEWRSRECSGRSGKNF